MRILSYFLTYVFFLNSIAVASGYEGREELRAILADQIIHSRITDVNHIIGSLKSWNELSKIVETLPIDQQAAFKSRIHQVKNNPFKLPEVVQTHFGIIIKSKDVEISLDLINSEILYQKKKMSFDKSSEELLNWLEQNVTIKVVSWDQLMISNAYADPVTATLAILVVTAIAILILSKRKFSCKRPLSELAGKIDEYTSECENGLKPSYIQDKLPSYIKNISAGLFLDATQEMCEKDIAKTFKFFGISCVEEIQAKSVCLQFNKLKQCMKTNDSAINDTSSVTKDHQYPKTIEKSSKSEKTNEQ